jgi:hypothetical protein
MKKAEQVAEVKILSYFNASKVVWFVFEYLGAVEKLASYSGQEPQVALERIAHPKSKSSVEDPYGRDVAGHHQVVKEHRAGSNPQPEGDLKLKYLNKLNTGIVKEQSLL